MKLFQSIIALFLIISHLAGLTNNLLPRCESKMEHQQHIIALHTSRYHIDDDCHKDIPHIGHKEGHQKEESLFDLLLDLFDDSEHPKENCEYGFFANVHHHTSALKHLVFATLTKQPLLFLDTVEESNCFIAFFNTIYKCPYQETVSKRGPPSFLV